MNPERLLQNFDRLIDMPDAVPRLRRFILDLAVRGKLVEQNPEDEPAAELLKRIKGEESFSKVTINEAPFKRPSNWQWVRIGECLELINGRAFKPTDWQETGLPIVRIQNLNSINAPFNFCDDRLVEERHRINSGSFLISWSGTPGTSFGAFIWERGSAALNQHIFKCFQTGNLFFDKFLRLAINGRLDEMIAKAHGGVGLQHITKGKLENLVLPLPPLAEQYRIVAKVDELMKLCDELEATKAKRERRRDRLVAATLHGLNNGKSDVENGDSLSFEDSAQFYFNHLSRLTTRTEHIQQLRQTILNLAVRGKLVPQDPKDEPTVELLKRIEAEKMRLAKEGEIKKPEPIPIALGEMPYLLPQGWSWCRIQDIFLSVTDGDHLPPPKADAGVPFLVIGNVRGRALDFTGCRYVSETYYFGLNIIRRPQEGDILYTLVGSYGIPVLLLDNRSFCVQRHIGILRPPKNISAGYLTHALDSSFVFDQATACATGIAQKTVPLNGLRKILIPLPPLAEQHRIVAKLDELMALCDDMEIRVTTTTTASRKLLEATLQEALDRQRSLEQEALP